MSRDTVAFELGMENRWCDTIPKYLNALGSHENILLTLDDMLQILVHGNIIRANQKVEEVERMKESIDWGVYREL